jgi:hypothetical protein
MLKCIQTMNCWYVVYIDDITSMDLSDHCKYFKRCQQSPPHDRFHPGHHPSFALLLSYLFWVACPNTTAQIRPLRICTNNASYCWFKCFSSPHKDFHCGILSIRSGLQCCNCNQLPILIRVKPNTGYFTQHSQIIASCTHCVQLADTMFPNIPCLHEKVFPALWMQPCIKFAMEALKSGADPLYSNDQWAGWDWLPSYTNLQRNEGICWSVLGRCCTWPGHWQEDSCLR